MKKFYVEAELEVISLLNADIITASGKPGVDGGSYPSDTESDSGGLWG